MRSASRNMSLNESGMPSSLSLPSPSSSSDAGPAGDAAGLASLPASSSAAAAGLASSDRSSLLPAPNRAESIPSMSTRPTRPRSGSSSPIMSSSHLRSSLPGVA